MQLRSDKQAVPRRALALSLASLAVPVAAAVWLPDWTSNGLGMLIWLSALIPAFLLAYYRGLVGVAIALVGGMAVITATQVSVVSFQIAEPNWSLLVAVVAVYLVVSVGIGGLAEMLRRERNAAEEMALVDRLTELPNRRYADNTLEREFAAAERGRSLTVVMFDLDRFKAVNDRHGHAAGDMTLKAFAKILQKNTRKENLSARYGGEEFVTILGDATVEAALVFAQRVLDQTREYPFPWGTQTVSAGMAGYEDGMGSHELLLAAADQALYRAKNGGRDMVCVATQNVVRVPTAAKRRPLAKLPASAAASAAASPASAGPDAAAPVPAAPPTRRMFIVDDDSAVRSVLKRMLVGRGYDIWDTGDPVAAVQQIESSSPADWPDVILTDVIMPQMTGPRMIDRITQVIPNVRVIYMSGYVQSEISWSGTPGTVVAFLAKPISMPALIAAVDGIMRPDAVSEAGSAANGPAGPASPG